MLDGSNDQSRPTCTLCARFDASAALHLGVCADCIRHNPKQALAVVATAHMATRAAFNLPPVPPRTDDGARCGLCVQDCTIGKDESGFCGLRRTVRGRLHHLAGTPHSGLLSWYRDPLPTNCVADWVCSGSHQRGRHNLAVFYAACTFNCLFCQNWHYRQTKPEHSPKMTSQQLADKANRHTYCVCYFGGDPAAQMAHSLATSRILAEQGVAICWETNGSAHPKLMKRAVDLALTSGGCVKFDLKAYDNNLHRALTGASNDHTLENLRQAAARFGERNDPPLIVVSTLLVPGYVEADEVERIARFVAGLDPRIPYTLLAFAPQFYMADLPTTSRRQASEAAEAARAAGLERVRIGNQHLLDQARRQNEQARTH